MTMRMRYAKPEDQHVEDDENDNEDENDAKPDDHHIWSMIRNTMRKRCGLP